MVFDIETIPDAEAGKSYYGFDGDDPKALSELLFAKRKEETAEKSDFLKHYLQKIVAISVVLKQSNRFTVWSLGELDSAEPELLQKFFKGVDQYTPVLVSWNGSAFDLPVIHYRALKHGIVGERYWDNGNGDKDFKWNNYLSRYHERHTDLMDVLSSYNSRAVTKLDEMAVFLGLPGKMGMEGGKVFEEYYNGNLKLIRDYCETDVLNTYFIYLRFQFISGKISAFQYEADKKLAFETFFIVKSRVFNTFHYS
jgi:predicted PolB exonuclease-like 3'-5' exonuclease